MKTSAPVFVLLAISSLLLNPKQSVAENRRDPRELIEHMKTVNAVIKKEAATLRARCLKQVTRKNWIDEAVANMFSDLTQLISDKATAEAELALATTDLTAAQTALATAAAALTVIDAQIANDKADADTTIANYERDINTTKDAKKKAYKALNERNNVWENWLNEGINEAELLLATYKKDTNEPLEVRDNELIAARNVYYEDIDKLEAEILKVERTLARLLGVHADAKAGRTELLDNLKKERTIKLVDKQSSEKHVKEKTRVRNLKRAKVLSLTARITKFSAIKAPEINIACKAFPETN